MGDLSIDFGRQIRHFNAINWKCFAKLTNLMLIKLAGLVARKKENGKRT
jgi:hypothetical protein